MFKVFLSLASHMPINRDYDFFESLAWIRNIQSVYTKNLRFHAFSVNSSTCCILPTLAGCVHVLDVYVFVVVLRVFLLHIFTHFCAWIYFNSTLSHWTLTT